MLSYSRSLKWGLVAAVVSLLSACASVNTTSGGAVGVERKQWMSGLVSEAELNQAAQQNYNEVLGQARAKGALDKNAAQTQRVKKIANRLIGQVGVFRPDATQWNWEVHVLTSDELNAWCMPGGKIAVYTGIINRLSLSDAELAAIIGHEMAHALREHSREQVSQQMATSVGLSILSSILGQPGVQDLGSSLSNVMFTLPNSRQHETEADLIGVELAARAGYDPRAAISLWEKMASQEQGQQSEFLSTHPSSASRIAELRRITERVLPLYQQASKP